MKKNTKMKNIKFLSLFSIILFFHGCSNDNKPESSEISETEDILLSYELSVDEKSLKHPIILRGAPGEDSKLIDPEAATNIAISTYVDADVDFLQGMIIHHQQAIVMSNMADKRTNNKTIVDLANRIDASQDCLLYTSPSPRDAHESRMPSSA